MQLLTWGVIRLRGNIFGMIAALFVCGTDLTAQTSALYFFASMTTGKGPAGPALGGLVITDTKVSNRGVEIPGNNSLQKPDSGPDRVFGEDLLI
jgi:hypothetical protein